MKTKGKVATTHVINGSRIAKEALDAMAEETNNGDKPFLSIEHEATMPPVGKIIFSWVEQIEDGEYALFSESEIFEKFDFIQLDDGVRLIHLYSECNNSPFVENGRELKEKTTIIIDEVNFQNKANIDEYKNDLSVYDDVEISSQVRNAQLPDPALIIELGKIALATYFGKKVLEKIGDKISEEISSDFLNVYKMIKNAIIEMAKKAIPKNKKSTYMIRIPGDPIIEFAAKTNDYNMYINNIHPKILEKYIYKAQEYRDLLDASKIQYILTEEGVWEFNYILTHKGSVIGNQKSIEKQQKELKKYYPEIDLDKK